MKIARVSTIACFWFFIHGFCPAASFAQDACMRDIKQSYKRFALAGQTEMPKDKVFYFQYTVRTAKKDSLQNGIYTSEVYLWASGKNVQINSSEMEMYQDKGDAFVVLPRSKQLVRLDPYVRNKKDQDVLSSRAQLIQDTLFALSKVERCVTTNGKQTVVLALNSKGRQMLNVTRVTFVLRADTKEMMSIKVEYEDNNNQGLLADVVYVEYTFNEINYDCRNKKLSDNLEKKFLSTPKMPSESYKGYTLVDNRHKKNKEAAKQWK